MFSLTLHLAQIPTQLCPNFAPMSTRLCRCDENDHTELFSLVNEVTEEKVCRKLGVDI